MEESLVKYLWKAIFCCDSITREDEFRPGPRTPLQWERSGARDSFIRTGLRSYVKMRCEIRTFSLPPRLSIRIRWSQSGSDQPPNPFPPLLNAVDGDPLTDISLLERPGVWVVPGGRVVPLPFLPTS